MGFQGVTHGYPLYLIIFNVVVVAVVQHWNLLTEEILGGQDVCGREGRHHGASLCV